MGFLGANVANGSLNLDADLQVQLANPDADAAGVLTLGELQGTSLSTLVTLNGAAATVNASLPITIYQYAGSAFAEWIQLAWVGALLITCGVLGLNIVARYLIRGSAR